MEQEQGKILIRKFITGNCTPGEQQQVKILLQQADWQELFDEVMDEDWRDFKKESPARDEEIQNFHLRLKKRLEGLKRVEEGKNTIIPMIKRVNLYKYAAVWAFLALCISAYSIWKVNKGNNTAIAQLSSYNPGGQRSKIVLSDSSVVTLGAGSRLSYPEHFTGHTREISLEGEAFFEVTKNPARPFIIHTGEVQTKVLGTSFKIEAFKGEEITVGVATGKVRVSRIRRAGKPESIAVLLPGDQVEWNPVLNRATKHHIETEALSGWKEGRLTFTGTPLREIAVILGRWYHVDIDIRNKEIREYKMNIILDGNLPLKQSLEILKATTKAGYQMNGSHIIIH